MSQFGVKFLSLVCKQRFKYSKIKANEELTRREEKIGSWYDFEYL